MQQENRLKWRLPRERQTQGHPDAPPGARWTRSPGLPAPPGASDTSFHPIK